MDRPASSSAALASADEPRARVEPSWIAEVRAQIADRVRPFLTTAREFLFHPKRFAKRWSSGEAFAMNPLWFAVTAVAVITTLQSALEDLLGASHRGVLENAVRTLAPYAYY